MASPPSWAHLSPRGSPSTFFFCGGFRRLLRGEKTPFLWEEKKRSPRLFELLPLFFFSLLSARHSGLLVAADCVSSNKWVFSASNYGSSTVIAEWHDENHHGERGEHARHRKREIFFPRKGNAPVCSVTILRSGTTRELSQFRPIFLS